MLKTEAITRALKFSSAQYLAQLYNREMEVQVNVAKDDGERVSEIYKGKRWTGWINPITEERWKSFRIPWNAKTEPQYEDTHIQFDMSKHTEGIGLTGWNWVKKESLWVGFDFDSMVNHKAGLTDDELNKIKTSLQEIDYVTILRSTSGKGLHVYIFIEPGFKTENHTTHAALARSILSLLSKEVGYSLENNVDMCGGVLWVYHRKQEGTNGLSLIKEGGKLKHTCIPTNWREHILVTSGKTKKIGIDFDDSTIKYIQLDDVHKQLLKWFSKSATMDNWWDNDHNMLICHTFDLKKAHRELNLKGLFDTLSSGTSSQNCFAFPLVGGGWAIRRHGKNVREHDCWTTDAAGWTKCLYNTLTDFETAARVTGGVENSSGEFIFPEIGAGLISALNLDPDLKDLRDVSVKEKQDKLIISVNRGKNDITAPKNFILNKKGNKWERVVKYRKPKKELSAPDYLLRHVISSGIDAGWYIKVQNDWILHNKSNAITVLSGELETLKHSDIETLLCECILNPWELVNIPFSEEYPGNRKWNKDSASLQENCEGNFPTWLSLFNHVGKNLTDSVNADPWCVENAIKTGGEYLTLWFSNMVQRPYAPLPYLFFVGEQNTGKSTLHEAIGKFILKRGYSRADNALINPQGFNAEIANAVLCVVEETDLRRNKDAANRLKDWVTGETIQVNQKYKTPYDINNTSHWLQCANDLLYCPIFPGDTRIVVVKVDPPDKELPKNKLFSLLQNEAKHFLYYILNLELPSIHSRLALPCIKTHEKTEIQELNMSELEVFIDAECQVCNGNLIDINEFYSRFQAWLQPDVRQFWTMMKFSRNFPRNNIYCKGKHGANSVTYIANIKFKRDIEVKEKDFTWKLNQHNGRLE